MCQNIQEGYKELNLKQGSEVSSPLWRYIYYIYFYSLITVNNLPSCTLDHFKSFDYFGCFRCLRWASSFHSDPLFLFVEDCQNKEKGVILSADISNHPVSAQVSDFNNNYWENEKAKGHCVTCRLQSAQDCFDTSGSACNKRPHLPHHSSS